MTITTPDSASGNRSRGRTGSQRDVKIQIVGRVSRRRYERHARSPAVQNLIESARRSWQRRYGSDPAAHRIKSVG
jgi:hypothetical protein